jgi:hypothetical protein
MTSSAMFLIRKKWPMVLVAAWLAGLASAQPVSAGDKQVYRCPGTPVLYTDSLSVKEAREKGCTALDGAPITVIAPQRPVNTGPAKATASPGAASRSGDSRIDPNEQRVRDNDARKILESELRKEEDSLALLKKDYNNGEPERLGDERNYQKYIDRVADMKARIARKEGDIAALKRELAKLP